ncbi:unnamed protein product [Rotaria magnacalcarata]|uniref:Ceramide transfer protein n=2 Tax=Rotaria magnacalcarata TaxID=392030 RepID=A0A819KX75_9BILA|nr:unnamed protein product [Rotaria magnacalcarata]CAF3951725.1 unnamed protein product [Rotaria magnacalcarata]
MASITEYATTSDDEESLEDEKTIGGSFRNGEFQGRLFKWTNYLHGWQERYLILRHGFLNYYKNEFDITLGCRGALSVKQATIQPHEFDDCRFDIRVSDSVWYLRAHNSDDRERWMHALEDHKQMCKNESGYGSETSLRRHPSLGSLASAASVGVTSTGSFRKDRGLKIKLSELETYRELLAQQVATLQTYFDACANAVTKGFEPYQKEYENLQDLDFEEPLDKIHGTPTSLSSQVVKSSPSKLSSIFLFYQCFIFLNKYLEIDRSALGDHAAMAVDFKGEALTFKATTDGVIHNLTFCIELMQKREEIWRIKYEKELERRKKFQDLYTNIVKQNIPALGSPDAEEGPHSTLKEDEFFDAIDQSLDRLDREVDDFQRSVTIRDKTKNPSVKSIGTNFPISSPHAFISHCLNPAAVVSPAAFISLFSSPLSYAGGIQPAYNQYKFILISTSSNISPSSLSIATIYSTHDDNFETTSSTHSNNDNYVGANPFEKLYSPLSFQSTYKVTLSFTSSTSSTNHKSTSERSTTSDMTKNTSTKINDAAVVSTPNDGNTSVNRKHRLAYDVERVVQEHLTYVREEISDGWDLIHQEGEMKVYRREVEENGIVVDPLKIFHSIKGVTGHEICHYFWDYRYRMEWETTLDSTKIIEVLEPDTVIFFQMHKRVWPAAQRDSCFWSHIRCISNSEEDQPTWLVVNYTTPHHLAPIKSPHVRLVANVALICETIINEPPLNIQDIKRENIECKLTYVAFVNPGGWVPSAALRSVAKREYPRFLKRFTSYVLEQTRDKPILF